MLLLTSNDSVALEVIITSRYSNIRDATLEEKTRIIWVFIWMN